MASQTDNSFFHQNLQEVKILIMVPHEDDEIMTAGAFAYNAAKCGADIYLMFSTNGEHQLKFRFVGMNDGALYRNRMYFFDSFRR